MGEDSKSEHYAMPTSMLGKNQTPEPHAELNDNIKILRDYVAENIGGSKSEARPRVKVPAKPGQEAEEQTDNEDMFSESDTEPEDDPLDTTFKPHEDDLNASPLHNPAPKTTGTLSTTRVEIAKTAKEYVGKLHARAESKFKDHIRKELAKKKTGGTDTFGIEPPKARRPRALANKGSTDGQPERPAQMPTSGALPPVDEEKVTAKVRDREITARKTQGTNNRRSGSQGDDLKEATRVFGYGKIQRYENSYQLKGMSSKLHDWQLTPAAWMVKREEAQAPPHGGVLADAPGMGKTVVALACIVGNPPSPKDVEEYSRLTLVVLPSHVVLSQWYQAFQKHVEPGRLRTCVYARSLHEQSRVQLSQFDVVLTTFSELRAYPSDEEITSLRSMYPDDEEGFRAAVKDTAGEVFGIKWYRIILDEGHEVRNAHTRGLKACYSLVTRSLWSLSATPLVNRSEELFPYAKLLRVEGITDFKSFKEAYPNSPEGPDKIDALVNLITYRRTKEDEFLGEQMLKSLPPFESTMKWVKLSPDERFIYDSMTNYSEPGRMLILRQRHMVSNPYNMEKNFRERFGTDNLVAMQSDLMAMNDGEPAKPQSGSHVNEGNGNSKRQIKQPGSDPSLLVDEEVASSIGEVFGMKLLLEYTINETQVAKHTCGKCKKKSIREPWEIDGCGHIFCYNCISRTWRSKSAGIKCPKCHRPYNCETGIHEVLTLRTISETYSKEDEEEAEQLGEMREEPPTKKVKGKTKAEPTAASRIKQQKAFIDRKYGADAHGVLPALDENDKTFMHIAMRENGGCLPLGAKLACARDEIVALHNNSPNDKIIFFHDFVKTSVAMGITLNAEGIPFVYLNGKVSRSQKDKAVNAFKYNKDIKVLVSSMKVGGQALNLTCANHIIQIDPYWNEGGEEQASGRVNRMGQEKSTHAIRIMARGTIDEFIVNLKEKKSDDIAHTLQDDGHETRLLSDWEIMRYTAPKAYSLILRRLLEEIREEIREEDAASVGASTDSTVDGVAVSTANLEEQSEKKTDDQDKKSEAQGAEDIQECEKQGKMED